MTKSKPPGTKTLQMFSNNTERKIQVVIFDDNESIGATMLAFFETEPQFSVQYFSNAIDGIQAIESMDIKPDVVITDLVMPNFNGLFVIKSIRKTLSDTIIIAMTGYSNKLRLMAEKKADYVFEKPVNLDELVKTIQECVKK